MSRLVSIVYSSSAVRRFSEADLVALLEQSREKNTRLGVTGLLLHKDLDFMQIIEGEEFMVQKLTSTIEKDARHRNYNELRWEVIRERRFADWSMGFRNLNNVDVAQMPGYSSFLDESLTSTRFKTDPSRAEKLLLLFREK